MTSRILLDTGPLVAFLSARDRFHEWAMGALEGVDAPLLTCEAVLSNRKHGRHVIPTLMPGSLQEVTRGWVRTWLSSVQRLFAYRIARSGSTSQASSTQRGFHSRA